VKIKDLYAEQEELSKKAVLIDSFDRLELIGGADCSYFSDKIIGGIAVLSYKGLDVVEKGYDVLMTDFPYIPGLLAYRESNAIFAALNKIKKRPDVLMIDGFGINHPRGCGIATYIGIKLNIPTIGIGKKFLCGTIIDDVIYQSSNKVGKLVYTANSIRPLYVSPGHKISLETSVRIVERCIRKNRLPEPARIAHEYVTEIKNRLKEIKENKKII
jgi:deoxyribonuclease V